MIWAPTTMVKHIIEPYPSNPLCLAQSDILAGEKSSIGSQTSLLDKNSQFDVENTPIVDHFPRKTIVFLQLSVNIYVASHSSLDITSPPLDLWASL